MKRFNLQLEPIPPFNLALIVWCLLRWPGNLTDRWIAQTYQRILAIDNIPVEVSVMQMGPSEEAKLLITVRGMQLPPETQLAVTQALEQLLGINVDLRQFYRLARDDKQLAPLVQRFRGLKPPRFPSLFEALVNGIACQQFTLSSGIGLLNKLVIKYGLTFPLPTGLTYSFPRPEDLTDAEPEVLQDLGFSRQKARALIELSQNITSGHLDVEQIDTLDDKTALEKLSQLRGVGRWTSEYALLRGLGRLHVFPADDIGGRNNLVRWLNITKTLDYDGIHQVLDKWQPYSGLLFFHLLLYRLAEGGYLGEKITL